jgi:release factor glutamine methyltransferase
MDHARLSSLGLRRELSVLGEDLGQWRQWALAAAIAADISPNEVDWLLRAVSDLDALALRLESFRARPAIPLSHSLSELKALWERRISDRVPVQYLIGQTTWRNFSLQVSPAVLIPRPETECLIDMAQAAVAPGSPLAGPRSHWADLGTGSGAIALGLATAFPQAQIHAVDISREALAIAASNAKTCELGDRIQFYRGQWFKPLAGLTGQLSGMVSNPPYIPTADVPQLQPEVAQHEPHLALDGGIDGLDCVNTLIDAAPDYLVPNGLWLVELMQGQAVAVAERLQQHPDYHQIEVHADLAGIDRFVLARRR